MSFISLWVKKSYSDRKRFLSCFLIILVSFALVVTALIFSKSMIAGIQDRVINLSGGHITVYGDTCPVIENVRNNKVTSGYAMLYSSDNTASVMIKGVDDSFIKTRLPYLKVSPDISFGRKNIIISKNLAEKLRVNKGQSIALMVLGEKSVRPEVCSVLDYYESGYSEIDDNIVFTSIDYACTLYPEKSSVSYELIIDDYSEEKLNNVEKQLFGVLHRNWKSMNAYILENLSLSNQAIVFILFLLIIFSSFFTLYTTQQIVNDLRKNIAVCKMLGCSDYLINKSIIISVLACVLPALLLGLILGLILGLNITSIIKFFNFDSLALKNYLIDFKSIIPIGSIILDFIMQLILSFVFIYISSSKSKKIKPIVLFRQI